MVHGELKMRLWTSMLDLEAFTVAELAEHAGVEQSQTYSELATLQKQGILLAESIQSAARHRPLNIYRVTGDSKLRQEFLDIYLAPRLLLSRKAASGSLRESEASRQAHVLLDEIDVEICQLELQPYVSSWHLPKNIDGQVKEIRVKLGKARSYLETAIYEFGLEDDKTAAPDHPVMIDAKRFRHFSSRTETLESKAQQVQLTLRAQRSFTNEILRAALNRSHGVHDSTFILGLIRHAWGEPLTEFSGKCFPPLLPNSK